MLEPLLSRRGHLGTLVPVWGMGGAHTMGELQGLVAALLRAHLPHHPESCPTGLWLHTAHLSWPAPWPASGAIQSWPQLSPCPACRAPSPMHHTRRPGWAPVHPNLPFF